jgi:hypothetical protein
MSFLADNPVLILDGGWPPLPNPMGNLDFALTALNR